jgi:hypothetical protein
MESLGDGELVTAKAAILLVPIGIDWGAGRIPELPHISAVSQRKHLSGPHSVRSPRPVVADRN